MERKIAPAKPYIPNEDMSVLLSEFEKVLESGRLTLGPYGKRFEEVFSKYIGTQFAISVSSGTSALEIALRSLGIKEGDEVIVPTNTFIATPNAVFFAGGKPVFADVSSQTLCLNPRSLIEKISSRTRGIIVVHIGGIVCPYMKELKEICKDHRLFLLEDAAHAHGSSLNGMKAGSLGDVACFSFYPTKVITTAEGGMITTNEKDLSEKAMILRDQGKASFLESQIVELGYNWRMSELHAVIGLHQLKRLEEFIEHRNRIARKYDNGLGKIDGIKPLKIPQGIRSNYYKYIAFLEPEINRNELKERLKKLGITLSGEVYDPPCHLQPLYKRLFGFKGGEYPNAEEIAKRHVCLPIYSQMTDKEAHYVLESLKEALS